MLLWFRFHRVFKFYRCLQRDENQSEIQHLKAQVWTQDAFVDGFFLFKVSFSFEVLNFSCGYNQAMALAAVMASQTVKGEGNMGAAVVLAPSRSAGVQVEIKQVNRCKVFLQLVTS